MKKTVPFIITFAAGFFLALMLFRGCGDKRKSNTTDNIQIATDTLKIIQEAKAPYVAQISEKEVIIQNLQNTVAQLEAMKGKGDKLAGNLAARLRKAESDLAKERGELTRLTLLLSETKADATAAITEKERDGVGVEIGEDLPPIYESEALEPNGWYKINATFDTYADTAAFKLFVRNDFEVAEYTDENGKARVRVTNRNPYTYSMPGTNAFDLKPVLAPVQRKHRFGLGIVGGAFAIKDFTGKDVNLGYGGGLALFYRIL